MWRRTFEHCRRAGESPVEQIEMKRGNNMRYLTAFKVAALALGLAEWQLPARPSRAVLIVKLVVT